MHFIRVVHYFFGISLTAHFVQGGSYFDVETLVNDKLNKYNNNLRPRLDQDDKVEVSVGFMVISYKEIDETEGEFSVSGTLVLTWTDEFLQWDPAKYNGTTNFSIDSSQVWTPSLSMFNNVNSNSMILQADQVLYYNSGYAIFVTHPQFTVPCAIDVQLYPWDSHTCYMMLIPRNSEHGLSLLKFYDEVNTDYLSTSNGWELVYTSVTLPYEDSILVFSYKLRRKALFSVLNTIFPILFMTGLSLMVFVVPTDSGERLSFCTTVLLSVLVFLSLVGDSLPKSTAAISFLSIFLVVILFVNVLITISTVISMHFYFKDDNVPVGKFWVMLEYVTSMRWFQPRFWSSMRSNKTRHAADARPNEGQFQNETNQYPQRIFVSTISYNGNGNEDIPVSEVSSEDGSNDDCTHCDLAAPQKQNTPVNTKNEPDRVKKEKGVVTWNDVSKTLDRLFFVVYTVLIVVVCIVFGKLVMP